MKQRKGQTSSKHKCSWFTGWPSDMTTFKVGHLTYLKTFRATTTGTPKSWAIWICFSRLQQPSATSWRFCKKTRPPCITSHPTCQTTQAGPLWQVLGLSTLTLLSWKLLKKAIDHFFPPRKDGCRRRRLIFQVKSKIILDPIAYVGLEPGSYFCCRLVARTSATCPRSVGWWTRRCKVLGGWPAPSSYSLLKSLAPPVGAKRYCCQSKSIYSRKS